MQVCHPLNSRGSGSYFHYCQLDTAIASPHSFEKKWQMALHFYSMTHQNVCHEKGLWYPLYILQSNLLPVHQWVFFLRRGHHGWCNCLYIPAPDAVAWKLLHPRVRMLPAHIGGNCAKTSESNEEPWQCNTCRIKAKLNVEHSQSGAWKNQYQCCWWRWCP